MDQLELRLQFKRPKPFIGNGAYADETLVHALRKLRKGKPVQILFVDLNRVSYEEVVKAFESRLNALYVAGEAYVFTRTNPHDARGCSEMHERLDVSLIITPR